LFVYIACYPINEHDDDYDVIIINNIMISM